MQIFGDVLVEQESSIDFTKLQRIIKSPVTKPRYRLSVLNMDETINYVIPNEDIGLGGISYTEEYQSGQRRNISLTLINANNKYTPSINGIWLHTKFKFEVGLETSKGETIWFPRGVYVMGDVDLTHDISSRTVQIQLKDKYAIFEDKTGTLENAYEIPVNSDIEQALKGIMNFSTGSGYIMDYKPIYLDPSLLDFKTQATIRVEEGGTIGEIINALATQLSAEYYYNNVGNLCFYPINETVNDDVKPIIWTFEDKNNELSSITMNYKNEEVVNVFKIVGDNITSGAKYATVENNNPASSICIQQVGRRCGEIIQDSNIWSNDLAQQLARYHLRKKSFMGIDFTTETQFNPFLTVNNICEIENGELNLKREKLLLISISYSSQDGLMTLKFCNTQDLPVWN